MRFLTSHHIHWEESGVYTQEPQQDVVSAHGMSPGNFIESHLDVPVADIGCSRVRIKRH